MKQFSFLFVVLAACFAAKAHDIVVIGRLPQLPDGTVVALSVESDSAFSVEVGQATLKDGRFILRGQYGRAGKGVLTTNNLELIGQNHWPMDSVHWNYIDLFVGGDTLFLHPDLSVTGTQMQEDFRLFQAADDVRAFLRNHPASVVSHWAACNLLKRAYNLNAEEVSELKENLKPNASEHTWYDELQQRLKDAVLTTRGMPLLDVAVADRRGDTHSLRAQLPQDKPYVLLDFWASWCGICLYQQPAIRKIQAEHADKLNVIAVSIDTDTRKWRQTLEKHPAAWPQYITTKEGFETLSKRYQIGNGVPYYLLLDRQGNVLSAIDRPESILSFINP
ncbi:MAG: TlpA disulfide reductase family protein [Bacteroidaceae bacterium]|nr:TlpA disulfide reductase family protein [Prevotellaceae bacterium]MDY5631726.1 TlpA disulfide reductase family protein [Bacteroidaceae bacterium]